MPKVLATRLCRIASNASSNGRRTPTVNMKSNFIGILLRIHSDLLRSPRMETRVLSEDYCTTGSLTNLML